MKNKASAIVCALLALTNFGCKATPASESTLPAHTNGKAIVEESGREKVPCVPEYVVFAGDTIRLDRDD